MSGIFFIFAKTNIIIMILPRKLVYKEKASRTDFEVNNKDCLNNIIYDKWLLTRNELDPEDTNFYTKITTILNDAYFVCTVVLMKPNSEISLSYFKKLISIPSIVYPMVCLYLSKLKERTHNMDRTIILIMDNLFKKHVDWGQNYTELLNSVGEYKGTINASLFVQRKLTQKLLYSINWFNVTNQYKISEIERIISIVAKDGEECKMMAEAIECEIRDHEEPDTYINDETGELELYTPDYSTAHQLCQTIISSQGTSLNLGRNEIDLFLDDNKRGKEEREFAPQANMKDFLKRDWFDEYSTDNNLYTVEWRNHLIDELIKSEHGEIIVNQWWDKRGKNVSKKNLIFCGLVGCLRDVGVIKCKNKTELASKLGISNVKNANLADYMAKKEYRTYFDWLKDYIQ